MSKAKLCHICRQPMARPHSAYPLLCGACGDLNEMKKTETADLSGRVALVTGGRIKIGRATVLRLLRNSAHVVATTRFPRSAMEEYAREPDFDDWKERLLILGLDLMRVDLLGEFIQHLARHVTHLDLLVNNAAQTVKDDGELTRWNQHELTLRKQDAFPVVYETAAASGISSAAPDALPAGVLVSGLPGTVSVSTAVAGMLASIAPQETLTLRSGQHSLHTPSSADWVKKSADVTLHDLLSVQIVNVTAPYLLAVGLKDLMEKSPHTNRFIVNVSSLEGKFSVKKKSASHPHTNMAKAALNMMTKTLAQEYKKHRIFVYSVDPGWVSRQFPQNWRNPQDYLLPLDFADSAARLTQPLFDWAEVEKPKSGIFLKDYFETEW